VSHLVVGRVVDEMWDLERAVVPLVEVVLFGLVDLTRVKLVRHVEAVCAGDVLAVSALGLTRRSNRLRGVPAGEGFVVRG